MPRGPAQRPSLAMKLWLWRRLGRNKGSEPSPAAAAHVLTTAMSLETLERSMRNRVRSLYA